jgi:hypothetical protein
MRFNYLLKMVAFVKDAKLPGMIDDTFKTGRNNPQGPKKGDEPASPKFNPTLSMKEWEAIHEALPGVAKDAKLDVSVNSLKELTARDPAAAKKLMDSLYPVYEKSFPDATQRTLRKEMEQVMGHYGSPRDILILRDGDKILGALHVTAYNTHYGKIAAIEYVYTNRDAESRNYGGKIISLAEKLFKKKGFAAFFGEINDPNVMTDEQIKKDKEHGINPYLRLKIMQRYGFYAIDALYIQPALIGQTETCDYMNGALKFLKEVDQAISKKDYLEIIEGYFRTFSRKKDYEPILKHISETIGDREYLAIRKMTDCRTYYWDKDKVAA